MKQGASSLQILHFKDKYAMPDKMTFDEDIIAQMGYS